MQGKLHWVRGGLYWVRGVRKIAPSGNGSQLNHLQADECSKAMVWMDGQQQTTVFELHPPQSLSDNGFFWM